jgi:ABC-type sugar transport system ATPase subunit
VADFVGSPRINLLPALVRGRRLYVGESEVATAAEDMLAAVLKGKTDSAQVLLGIRPEWVTISRVEDGIPGKVVLIEPVGAQVVVTVQLASGDTVRAAMRGRAPSPGEDVGVRLQQEGLMLFDVNTGIRLAP